jgi:PAS domain S-box-containing protein
MIDAIVVIGVDKKIISMNRQAEMLTGFTSEDAQGRFCHEVLSIGICEERCPIEQVLRENAGVNNFDVPFTTHAGETVPICLNTTPLLDETGRITGVVENLRVIDHVKSIITEIERERSRTQSILDSLDEGVYTINDRWEITSFNRTAEEITGYTRDEVIGRVCSAVFDTPLCKKGCPLKELLSSQTPVQNVLSHFTHRQGEKIPVIINVGLFREEEGRALGAVTSFRDVRMMEAQVASHKNPRSIYGIVGDSPPMQQVYSLVETAAQSDVTVLITGESGTGKNLVAEAVHRFGKRNDGPFIKVNMSAIPENLIESELYGHQRGAFTGADRDQRGKFDLAAGGTLFLDEISEMSIASQAKLLQVIQDKEYYTVGGTKLKQVDARIIAATNRDLTREIEEGRFREDLLYRLKVFPIQIPPLRTRVEDIPPVIHHVLEKLNIGYSQGRKRISPELMDLMRGYHWPGNVREIENILEYGYLCTEGDVIEKEVVLHLLEQVREDSPPNPAVPDDDTDGHRERERLLSALSRASWNRAEASRMLGIDRTTLWRRMKKHNITPP